LYNESPHGPFRASNRGCRLNLGLAQPKPTMNLLAEAADHNPDIDIRYSKVTLRLVTQDAGGLTHRDTALAAQAERFA